MADVKKLKLFTPLSFVENGKEVVLDKGDYLLLQQSEENLFSREEITNEFDSYVLWNQLVWEKPLYLRIIQEEGHSVYQWLARYQVAKELFRASED